MKKTLRILIFFISIQNFAQSEKPIENQPERLTITQKAEFPGGERAFVNEFMRMAYAYTDLDSYKVNGTFDFIFTIDKKGKISNLIVHPKVKNSEMFIEDMQFAMRKVKAKWSPAMSKGTPVETRYILKINFDRNDYDHD